MATRNLLVAVVLVINAVLIETADRGDKAYTRNKELPSDTVVIGAVLPVHTSLKGACGPINALGVVYSEAIAYVIEKINKKKDFIPGVTLAFDIRDSCSSINDALEETLDLLTLRIQQKGYGVSAMIGEFSSAVTIPIAQLLKLFQLPLISFSATDPSLSDKSQFNNFFRTVPSDYYEAKALTHILDRFNWTYVAAVYSGDVYGRAGMAMFIKDYKNDSAGRCIAGIDPIEIPYPGATTEDYDAAVKKLVMPYLINASVVVAFAQLETVNGLLDAVERRRALDPTFTKEFVWVGSDMWTDALNTKRLNSARNIIGLVSKEINNYDFNAYFTSLHISNHTDNPWFGEYWEYYFNCSLNGTNTSHARCDTSNQHLATGYRDDILYLARTLDAAYTVVYAIRDLQKNVCNGSDGLCSAALSTSRFGSITLDGNLLSQFLLKVNFTRSRDAGGSVTFDQNGDIPAEYTVENLQGSVVKPVGNWVYGKSPALNISQPIIWNRVTGSIISFCSAPCDSGEYSVSIPGQSSCCWTCSSCKGDNPYSDGKTCKYCEAGNRTNDNKNGCTPISVNYNYLSTPWAMISMAIATIGIVTATILGSILLVNINHKVVVASSRELTTILFIGVYLCYSMPFVFIATPSPALCAIKRFGVGFSFSACFVPILVRVNRIHTIFNSEVPTKTRKFTYPLGQVILALLLLSIQVIIIAIWLALEPPGVQYVYSLQSGEVNCSDNPYAGLSVSLGYNAIILAFTMYFAFRTRKVPHSFNETKLIGLTACILIVIWIAFIPIYFGTAALGSVFQTSSQVLAIVLSATAVLGCFLVPKVYIVVSNKWKEYHVSSEVASRPSVPALVPLSDSQSQRARKDSALPST